MRNWTLYFGDCAEQLQHIASNSVDLVVASPPYTNQRFATYGGVTPDGYVAWFLPIADDAIEELNNRFKARGSCDGRTDDPHGVG